MPRFSASSQAKRTNFHHSGVKAMSSPEGLSNIFVAQGEHTSAMPKIVAAPMPVSLNQSRSLTIPSRLTLLPIQCHHTPVLALCGGFRNTASGSGAPKENAAIQAVNAIMFSVFISSSSFLPIRASGAGGQAECACLVLVFGGDVTPHVGALLVGRDGRREIVLVLAQ